MRLLTAVLALLLAAVPMGAAAQDAAGKPAAFFGSFRFQPGAGIAAADLAAVGLGGATPELRIEPLSLGFAVTWFAPWPEAGLADPGAGKVTLGFKPSDRHGLYQAAEDGDLFEREPVAWAAAGERSLTIQVLRLQPDGAYDFATYTATRDEGGLALTYAQLREGSPPRQVAGRLVKP